LSRGKKSPCRRRSNGKYGAGAFNPSNAPLGIEKNLHRVTLENWKGGWEKKKEPLIQGNRDTYKLAPYERREKKALRDAKKK